MYLLEIVGVVNGVQIEVPADNGDVTLRSKGQEPRRIVPSWRGTLWRWHRRSKQRN
jgi:hypothetical protein